MKKVILVLVALFVTMGLYALDHEDEVSQMNSVANSMSQITGTAISPLIATACIGTYKYINTAKDMRGDLPWYYRPGFIVICIVLSVLVFLIELPSTVGNLPPQVSEIIKRTNHILGLVLTTPLILSLISPAAALLADNAKAALVSNTGFVYASIIPLGWIATVPGLILSIVTSIALFFVYIATITLNTVFDVLIFLCPFGWIKTLFNTIRGGFLGILTILSAIYPPLSFIITIPVMIISVIVFAWSVRRVVMGFIYMKDFIFKKKEMKMNEKGILAFSEKGIKMPTKCMGRIIDKDGNWIFTYRKFFIFEKAITVEKNEPSLKKGFLYSQVFNKEITVCSLPPRYQKFTEYVQTELKIEKLEDGKLKKGIKALFAWIKDFFSRKTESAYA